MWGRGGGDVLHLTHEHVVDVDLVGRGSLWFHFVCQVSTVGRPRGIEFSDLASLCQVYHLPGLRRNQKNIPLLVAIVVGLISDPFAIRRPGGRRLALVADGERHRPSTIGSNGADVVASARV